jgi:hypothetical protein
MKMQLTYYLAIMQGISFIDGFVVLERRFAFQTSEIPSPARRK